MSQIVDALLIGSQEINRQQDEISRVTRILKGVAEASAEDRQLEIALPRPVCGYRTYLQIDVKAAEKKPAVFRLVIGPRTFENGSTLPAEYIPELHAQLDDVVDAFAGFFPRDRTIRTMVRTGRQKMGFMLSLERFFAPRIAR
jgi:hypothetical protein